MFVIFLKCDGDKAVCPKVHSLWCATQLLELNFLKAPYAYFFYTNFKNLDVNPYNFFFLCICFSTFTLNKNLHCDILKKRKNPRKNTINMSFMC